MASNKVFVDSDVLLDVFLARKPFDEPAVELLSLASQEKLHLVVSSLSYSNVFYVLRKATGKANTIKGLQTLNAIVTTASVTDHEIKLALASSFTDFEDAIQYNTAVSSGCQYFVTRNVGHYKLSKITVLSPAKFIELQVWK